MEVWNQKGAVPVENGAFRIDGYDDYTVIIKAFDQNGNAGSELIRYVVDQDGADPEDVFRHMDIANVGAVPGEAAISVVTDQAIKQAWVQVQVAGGNWQHAITQAVHRPARLRHGGPGPAGAGLELERPRDRHGAAQPRVPPDRARTGSRLRVPVRPRPDGRLDGRARLVRRERHRRGAHLRARRPPGGELVGGGVRGVPGDAPDAP